VICPHCGEETFVDLQTTASTCICCGKAVDTSIRLKFDNRTLPLTEKTEIYFDSDNMLDGIVTKDNSGILLIKNRSNEQWTVETKSGKIKLVQSDEILPVKEGLKISLSINNIPFEATIVNLNNL
jgi:hypothetical protein